MDGDGWHGARREDVAILAVVLIDTAMKLSLTSCCYLGAQFSGYLQRIICSCKLATLKPSNEC